MSKDKSPDHFAELFPDATEVKSDGEEESPSPVENHKPFTGNLPKTEEQPYLQRTHDLLAHSTLHVPILPAVPATNTTKDEDTLPEIKRGKALEEALTTSEFTHHAGALPDEGSGL